MSPETRMAVSPDIQAELDRCNKCGFCMAGCPTYKAKPFEWLVTRGRVSLLQDIVEGRIDPDDPGVVEAIDSCLKCRACVIHCPPRIEIDKLVGFARSQRRGRMGFGIVERFLYRVLLARPRLFSTAVSLGYVAERTGLRGLVTRSGALKVWPVLQRAAETGPVFPARSGRRLIELERRRLGPVAGARDRVAYFLGCAKNNLYGEAAAATFRVLHRNGVEVELPEVVCCGLPCHSAGDLEGARNLAKKNLAVLNRTGARTVVVDESSCCSHLRHLGELFAGLPEQTAMEELSGRVVDLVVYLDRLGIETPGRLPGRIGWHDPCHLRHHEGVIDAPRNLLRSVPGAELVESTMEPGCCGGAGAIMLTQPALSDAILEARLEGFRAAGAQAIITGSPSCVTQYRRARNGLPVLYLSEYLDRAYRAKEARRRYA